MGNIAPSHEKWTDLLQKHVHSNGFVDYRGFIEDSLLLNEYLSVLSDSAPNPKKWTEAERLVYWINAYNAFTVQIVIRHYPVNGIKDIASGLKIPFVSSTWDIPFIRIGGEDITLNRIEHGIIRKEFKEPRIHFAVNCASVSCPVLRNEAYEPEKLEQQLEEQAIQFINDQSRNNIKSGEAELSKLFTWFSKDFKRESSNIIDYVNRYSETIIERNAKITYMDYNWSLNDEIK